VATVGSVRSKLGGWAVPSHRLILRRKFSRCKFPLPNLQIGASHVSRTHLGAVSRDTPSSPFRTRASEDAPQPFVHKKSFLLQRKGKSLWKREDLFRLRLLDLSLGAGKVDRRTKRKNVRGVGKDRSTCFSHRKRNGLPCLKKKPRTSFLVSYL
jgi:hypothetical protein